LKKGRGSYEGREEEKLFFPFGEKEGKGRVHLQLAIGREEKRKWSV